ncbi:hypothetical protein SEA_STICKYNOTE_53 [Corynebacterium phage Stickynote]|uniref:Uncharacterized protein n=1 Tax=Corynebacterium phage Stickynote TaxID=2588503 RepID=A0A4Y6EKK7_9CAUD|nr:methyltransferase [Corynebacterium phage Stickynote]QDF19246.1 hypothetical protein SEA_STICKYNOTE_53 [Corynebacterium phage Stickynote]
MGFSIPITRVKSSDVEKARADSGQGQRYDGPTPPPGLYNTKIKKVWYQETRKGDPALNVLFEIHEEGANEVYNGAGAFRMFMIPTDPSYEHFSIQVSSIESLLLALSDGTYTYDDFLADANAGRIIAGKKKSESDKKTPIEQMGRLKITGEQTAQIKTKVQTYNGDERMEVHYVLSKPLKKKKVADIDMDFDDDDTDLDDWMSEND